MTEPRRRPGRLARGCVAVVLVGLAAGCSGEPPTPIAEDELPGEVVDEESDTRGTPTVSSCQAVNQAQEQVAVSSASSTDDGYRYWRWWLDDGTHVSVAVMTLGYPFEDPEAALASVREALGECGDQAEQVDGLPDDVLGYRSATSTSNGDRAGTTLLAGAGDRVVSLSVSQDAGATPAVEALDLLAQARDRAADLDLG